MHPYFKSRNTALTQTVPVETTGNSTVTTRKRMQVLDFPISHPAAFKVLKMFSPTSPRDRTIFLATSK